MTRSTTFSSHQIIRTQPAEGYWGIWHGQPSDQHRRGPYKYSGGLGTYPQQHMPIAIYRQDVRRTYFVYGGAAGPSLEQNHLQVMISYLDHKTGQFPRPRILLDKPDAGTNPHENPTLQIDDGGHLWVFANQHGPQSYRDHKSCILRSVRPHDITEFEVISRDMFSYSQPWNAPGRGLILLHSRYTDNWVRELMFRTCTDGRTWSKSLPLTLESSGGHYMMSWRHAERIGVVMDWHPDGNLDRRTNLYYLETADLGRTWRTVDGREFRPPAYAPSDLRPGLVHHFEPEGLLVYFKDLAFDESGHPVLLYLTSRSSVPGLAGGMRTWHTARWTGSQWERYPLTQSSHNYDHGSLYIERRAQGTLWRVLGPTEPGPQIDGTGGEVALWESADRGRTWARRNCLTTGSAQNHMYVRRPADAHPDFYALWADGDPQTYSPSHLYITSRACRDVWRLPTQMEEDGAAAEPWQADEVGYMPGSAGGLTQPEYC
jgi:hypothetical protein